MELGDDRKERFHRSSALPGRAGTGHRSQAAADQPKEMQKNVPDRKVQTLSSCRVTGELSPNRKMSEEFL